MPPARDRQVTWPATQNRGAAWRVSSGVALAGSGFGPKRAGPLVNQSPRPGAAVQPQCWRCGSIATVRPTTRTHKEARKLACFCLMTANIQDLSPCGARVRQDVTTQTFAARDIHCVLPAPVVRFEADISPAFPPLACIRTRPSGSAQTPSPCSRSARLKVSAFEGGLRSLKRALCFVPRHLAPCQSHAARPLAACLGGQQQSTRAPCLGRASCGDPAISRPGFPAIAGALARVRCANRVQVTCGDRHTTLSRLPDDDIAKPPSG